MKFLYMAVILSFALNIAQTIILKLAFNHIGRLQKEIQPLEPLELFDSEPVYGEPVYVNFNIPKWISEGSEGGESNE